MTVSDTKSSLRGEAEAIERAATIPDEPGLWIASLMLAMTPLRLRATEDLVVRQERGS